MGIQNSVVPRFNNYRRVWACPVCREPIASMMGCLNHMKAHVRRGDLKPTSNMELRAMVFRPTKSNAALTCADEGGVK